MIRLADNIFMCEREEDLPLPECKEIFLDVETTSFNKKLVADYPWRGDRICGVAVTWDDHPQVYYVPVRHSMLGSPNLPEDVFRRWLKRILEGPQDWVNHNVKFDGCFAYVDGVDVIGRPGRLVDTLTLGKMHDTDRRGHGLKQLCREWLELEMSEEIEISHYLKSIKSKDYGDVPADILGRYACMDVIGNRKLYRYLQAERPAEYEDLWNTEIALTSVLLDTEIRGIVLNRQEVKTERVKTITKIIDLQSKIAELTGLEYKNSSTWIYDYLINVCGLPVLSYHDKTGRPTFNKKALRLYAGHPLVASDKKLSEAVTAIMDYRREAQYEGLFLGPFLELADSAGRIHPRYNQLVRTSRMSCSTPNIQQQNKRSKMLFHPEPGRCFISWDYSQIEFRLIAHYAGDQDVIAAYQNDPHTDFHRLSASLIYHVPVDQITKKERSPAKTLNFGMGFGMGRRKAIESIRTDPLIIAEVNAALDTAQIFNPEERSVKFEELAQQRAEEMYSTYHERMPGIRRVSEEAAKVCKYRGYIFNAYKRRRHLPLKVARKAFNNICQGTAMDIIKEAMVKTSHLYDPFMAERDVRILLNVHDEIVYDAPVELMYDRELHAHVVGHLESPSVRLTVPIRVEGGVSAHSWAEAASDEPVLGSNGSHIGGRLPETFFRS